MPLAWGCLITNLKWLKLVTDYTAYNIQVGNDTSLKNSLIVSEISRLRIHNGLRAADLEPLYPKTADDKENGEA